MWVCGVVRERREEESGEMLGEFIARGGARANVGKCGK